MFTASLWLEWRNSENVITKCSWFLCKFSFWLQPFFLQRKNDFLFPNYDQKSPHVCGTISAIHYECNNFIHVLRSEPHCYPSNNSNWIKIHQVKIIRLWHSIHPFIFNHAFWLDGKCWKLLLKLIPYSLILWSDEISTILFLHWITSSNRK